MKWENIFTKTSDKGLRSKIYKELTKCNTKKPNNPIIKWIKDLNRHFSKETYRWPIGQKMLSVTNIREMHIKTMMRYHLTSVRMAIVCK